MVPITWAATPHSQDLRDNQDTKILCPSVEESMSPTFLQHQCAVHFPRATKTRITAELTPCVYILDASTQHSPRTGKRLWEILLYILRPSLPPGLSLPHSPAPGGFNTCTPLFSYCSSLHHRPRTIWTTALTSPRVLFSLLPPSPSFFIL